MSLKKTAKSILFKLPTSWTDSFYKIYNIVFYPKMREKKESYGPLNKDKTFYVIRPRTDCVEGLMSLFDNVLRQISYAEAQEFIPVVDFENYSTQYQDASLSEKNVWNYFFTQPSQYSLEEVYQSKNVILSGLNSYYKCYGYLNKDFTDSALKKAHEFMKKYIDYSDRIKELYEKEKKIIVPEQSIGLYLRGTDYIALKPAGESRQPTPEEAFDIVDRMLVKYSVDRVFLVTEDESFYNKAIERYGFHLRITSFDMFVKDYKGIDFLSKDSALEQLGKSPYSRGAHYLVKLMLLARCRAIVGGKTCGSWAACVMADEKVEKYMFEKGLY